METHEAVKKAIEQMIEQLDKKISNLNEKVRIAKGYRAYLKRLLRELSP